MNILANVDVPVVIPSVPTAVMILIGLLVIPILLSLPFAIPAYVKANKVDRFGDPIDRRDRDSAGALWNSAKGGALIGAILLIMGLVSGYSLGPHILGTSSLHDIEEYYNVSIVTDNDKVPIPFLDSHRAEFYEKNYPMKGVQVYPDGIFNPQACDLSIKKDEFILYCAKRNAADETVMVEYDPNS